MFNHYHYWPDAEVYRRQEKLLEEARIEQLIRRERPAGSGLISRLAAALSALLRRPAEPPQQQTCAESA